ncbi:MAG: S8 family serine peptidase [Xanthomonadales bacterium]|nr:S8 family serine peptidase [Xanthomonadales bacterium]
MRSIKRLLVAGFVALAGLGSVQADLQPMNSSFNAVDTSPVSAKSGVYIVQMKGNPAVAYTGGTGKFKATKPGKGKKINPNSAHVKKYVSYLESMHDEALKSVGASEKIYSYRYALNGFAAVLSAKQVKALGKRSDVVNIWRDEIRRMQTETTPDYLGLTGGGGVWDTQGKGEDIIVGILDSGIWPEHPSFSDQEDFSFATGNSGKRNLAYGPPPGNWNGSCQSGERWSQNHCNNKIIGARYYPDGFSANGNSGLLTDDFLSARDSDGHGSHVAGTAVGNEGPINTINFEPVSGMAPRARIAVYKVCWDPRFGDPGCASSDSAAAIDDAVADGVDVINFSIGGSSTSFSGPDDIAFLFAAAAGVYVATSNGNSGPDAQTTGTPAGVPWITGVGAAQDDQVFYQFLNVSGALNDSYLAVEGSGEVTFVDTGDISADVVLLDDGVDEVDDGEGGTEESSVNDACEPAINGADLAGNIALVIRGTCSFIDKYDNAAAAGAVAIIVYNDGTADDRQDPITMSVSGVTIPGAMISFTDGDTIANAGGIVMGVIGPGTEESADNRIAEFSSRGPNGGAPDIIKPDVVAPGVSIIAAETLQPNSNNDGGVPYQSISGTSMSSPHVAGIFALLKEAHPGWSAAAAKSALMTSARQNLKKTYADDAADPFDIGAGAIVPAGAFEPGLVYDAGLADYVAFSCENNYQIFDDESCDFVTGTLGYPTDASDLNLASIGVADLVGSQTVTRYVTSVTEGETTFDAVVAAPPGIDVVVTPTQLVLEKGDTAMYTVQLTPNGSAVFDEWTFGSLTWTNDAGATDARSPIAVRPLTSTNVNVLTKSVDESTAVSGDTLQYQISVTNDVMAGPITMTDMVPAGTTFLSIDSETITGGATTTPFAFDAPSNSVSWTGELDLGELNVSASPSPFGYFSLREFGEDPFDLPSNCDDGALIIDLPIPFTYNGASYSSVTWSVNGTIEAGEASGLATSFDNQELPDSTLPNNLLAPFWRDLNLCDSGNWYVSGLFDGSNVWWVFEWEDAPHFGSSDAVTMQVWIASDFGGTADGDIYFVYQRLDNTDDGVTVGAENASGTIGDNYFYQSSLSNPDPAVGTAPEVGVDLIVETLPGGNATLEFSVTTDCSEDVIVNKADISSGDISEEAIAVTACSSP